MKTTPILRSFAGSFALLVCSFSLAEQAASKYDWTDNEEQGYLELSADGTPLVRYMYTPLDESSDERRAETYKPYLHVYRPHSPKLLTKGPGGLFPHHRGIFFGFNKVTYGDGKQCDTWHCHGKAYEEHQDFADVSAGDDGGSMESIIKWHGQEGETFATEWRRHTIGQQDGMTRIDFESTIVPEEGVGKIHLDGDPQHAGVQFRATQDVPDKTAKETYYIRTDGVGKPGETRNWDHQNADAPMNGETTNRPWLGMSCVVDGQRYTVLYLDHPDNPKPSHYSERDYGRFGSFFVTDVTSDDPLELKYRYFVKKGEMSVEECQALSDQFVGGE